MIPQADLEKAIARSLARKAGRPVAEEAAYAEEYQESPEPISAADSGVVSLDEAEVETE